MRSCRLRTTMIGVFRFILLPAMLLSMRASGAGISVNIIANSTIAYYVQVLPMRSAVEVVQTRSPQRVDVTIARVPADDVALIDHPPWTGDLDPRSKVVFRLASESGGSIEHRIVIPPLPAGIYQVRFRSPDRTAVQELNVGTLAAMLDRGFDRAVLMAVDARTQGKRNDAVVLEYTSHGMLRFGPSKDGIFRFPYPLIARAPLGIRTGTLIVRAEDGSMVTFAAASSWEGGVGTYFQTDRHVYRAGDRIFYRYFSLDPSLLFALSSVGWETTKGHVITGSFVLPHWVKAGYDQPDGFFVTSNSSSSLEIEAAALTPEYRKGETAHFIISATRADGTPAAGQRIPFQIYDGPSAFDHDPEQEDANIGFSYGHATTNVHGDALVSLPAQSEVLEVWTLQPNTGEMTASARAVLRPKAALTIVAPSAIASPRCIPLAFTESDAAERPLPARHIAVQILAQTDADQRRSGRPIFTTTLTTGSGGYAIQRWCARALPDQHYYYRIAAHDERDPQIGDDATLTIEPSQSPSNGVTFVAPDAPPARRGAPVGMTATSLADGDALVVYGSGYTFRATSAHFQNGEAHFDVAAIPEADDFIVNAERMEDPSRFDGHVRVSPKTHLLHVALSCIARTNDVCVRVSNWHGEASARLFVDVTRSTRAGIADAIARANDPYQQLYTPAGPIQSFETAGWASVGSKPLPKSYLYPSPVEPRRQPAAPSQPASASPAPTPTETPWPPVASQTLAWFNEIMTDRHGYKKIQLGGILPAKGTFLVRVIALSDDGSIGESVTGVWR